MKKNYKKGLALLMSLALAVSASVVPSSEAAAKKPSLSAKKKTLYYNGTKKFTLKVKKNKAKKIVKTTWKTNNKKVATVSKTKKTSAVVTAKKKGTAKITAVVTYKQGSKNQKVTLTCTVTSKKKAVNTGNTDTGSTDTGSSATATPAPSAAATATPTPGTTATATPTPAGTATATPTPAGDATATPTPGGEATATPTPAGEATATPTPAGDATATPTPGGEATATPTPGGEATATPTPGGEATATPTPGGEETPTPDSEITETVTGTAYLDTTSTVTVKFSKENEEFSSEDYGVKINGTVITTDNQKVNLATVKSVTYTTGNVTVSLEMQPLNGWHEQIGSYKVDLIDKNAEGDDDVLKAATVEYSLDGLSADDTVYESIDLVNNSVPAKAWYKVDGTKMYVLTIVKQPKIHCDSIKAGDTTYEWWNGVNSQIYFIVPPEDASATGAKSTVYSVGSHVFYNADAKTVYANGIGWFMDGHTQGDAADQFTTSDALINADAAKVTRSYMKFGTFDDDTDTDKGCVLLNVVDLTLAGFTEESIKGQKITMDGYVGPNDGTGAFSQLNNTKEYLLAPADDTADTEEE